MIPFSKLPIWQQCLYLNRLKSDVNVFGPDQINMIKSYFKNTGIHTNIIKDFENLRDNLKKHHITDLGIEYIKMRKRFVQHLENRISLLKNPEKGHDIDPWMEQSFASENDDVRDQLREISHHIQDVLVACEVVCENNFNGGIGTAIEDLEGLKANLVEKYISFLRDLIDKKDSEELLKDLPKEIGNLEEFLNEQQLNKALKLLRQIKQELNVNAVALKKL